MDNITYGKDLPDIDAPFALQYLNGLLLESRVKLDICIFSASLAYRPPTRLFANTLKAHQRR